MSCPLQENSEKLGILLVLGTTGEYLQVVEGENVPSGQNARTHTKAWHSKCHR